MLLRTAPIIMMPGSDVHVRTFCSNVSKGMLDVGLRLGCPPSTICSHQLHSWQRSSCWRPGAYWEEGGGVCTRKVEWCVSLWLELPGCICCVQTAGLPCNRFGLFGYVMLRMINTENLLCCVYMMPASATCMQLYRNRNSIVWCMFVFSGNLYLPSYQFKWSWIVTIDYLKVEPYQ